MTQTVLDGAQPLLARIAEHVDGSGRTVAVAESLTAGLIATQLGAAEASSTWFAGGVVAYTSETKYEVLGVERGPVVTAACAEQMAAGVARLLRADVAVAVTGVGGPTEEEGKPAGTVFVGGCRGGRTVSEEHHLDGGPPEVLQATTLRALDLLGRLLAEESAH
ncbi:CinA family protein [Georgenia sp. TF02-10]|uniref:CinA family protein n=1 Tax=Georgenia sp. TF02-10 TaxID=2917725 RepID=UPI001FA72810|nr:CinA family protein [Georgenia sp. TF02-10]UNX53227.1 CinA family protein [Georgenia sp. TF02-10]